MYINFKGDVYMKKSADYIKCSCGNTYPKRWIDEGKAVQKGKNSSYCVKCADDFQYNDLINKFSHFIQINK
jgi:hypothetical protein